VAVGNVHAVQVSFFVDPRRRAPRELLSEWHSLVDIATCAAAAGVRTSVVQAHNRDERLTHRGIDFHFVSSERSGVPLSGDTRFASLVAELAPDIVHVHGLSFSRDVLALRECLPRLPILLQDHADRPPRWWRRGAWRRGVAAADGVSFCARAQAQPFTAARDIAPHVQIFEIPESTSFFTPGDRAAARASTGLSGDPCVLWVGHLDANKDPLTVLDGVSAAISRLPGLELWCCYGSAPLLGAVEARIGFDAQLRGRVHLLSRVPHERIEMLMRAADLFVLGSHREGSSFATIEALATGLPPVVTDIPSLRALAGEAGSYWHPGDSASLTSALLSVVGNLQERRVLARNQFEREIGAPALGRKLRAAYAALIKERSSDTA
jgi:glycosyltransferase involved in cell wall biosynthesis